MVWGPNLVHKTEAQTNIGFFGRRADSKNTISFAIPPMSHAPSPPCSEENGRMAQVVAFICQSSSIEGDIRTARTAWCTARAPRLGFYQPFPTFFTFFQGGKDAVA